MGSLFYGLILKREEVMAIKEQVAHRRRVEKDERPIGWRMIQRLEKILGSDRGLDYTLPRAIRQSPEIEQIVTMIDDYLPDAVSLEITRGLPDYLPDPLFTLQVSGMSWGPSDTRLQFNPDTAEADRLLREVCDTYGLAGQTPEFHLLGNLRFFYGLPVLFSPSEADLPFLKQVTRLDYLDLHDDWTGELIAKIAPEKYKNWVESEEIIELSEKEDWAEIDARFNSLAKSIFESEEFAEWKESKDLCWMLSDEFLQELDDLWETRGDPVGILRVYGDPLEMRATPHMNASTIFLYARREFLEFGKEAEWDELLRKKCETYGLKFIKPGFCLIEWK